LFSGAGLKANSIASKQSIITHMQIDLETHSRKHKGDWVACEAAGKLSQLAERTEPGQARRAISPHL
jgi:hypothetical protein